MKYIQYIALIVVIILFSHDTIYSQSSQNSEEKKFPNLPVSPSPNSYEMAKYVDFPVLDNYGIVPISIPIFSIGKSEFKHSISLDYHASGIKVGQEATWVGLGWNLKAGGMITRSIRDLADDEVVTYEVKRENLSSGFDIKNKVKEYGWLSNPDRIKNFPDIETVTTNKNYKNVFRDDWEASNLNSSRNVGIALNALYDSYGLTTENAYLRYDCEPDIYYLSVNDISLKFIFGFDGNVKLLNSNQKVKITPFYTNENITSFEVTDQKGYKYYFGGTFIEKTTVSTDFHQIVVPDLKINEDFKLIHISAIDFDECTIAKTSSTAWFLYKIKSPNGDEMNFDYNSKLGLKMSIPANLLQTKAPTTGAANFVLKSTWNNLKSINHSIDTYYLKEITHLGSRLDFNISQRTDIENGYKLDSINLYYGSTKIRSCSLKFNYMNSSGTFKVQRLMLDKLIIDNSQTYSLEYTPGNLPAKDSYQQDFWGYYSTKSTGFIPRIYVYPDLEQENRYRCYTVSGKTPIIIPGSDRTCDTNNILKGTLSKITYPTRGYSKYFFEPNSYYDDLALTDIIGGGIRIASIEKYNNTTPAQILIKENYSYTKSGHSSGVLINQLAFATPTNYTFDPTGNSLRALYEWECTGTNWPETKKYEYFTVRSSNSFFPLTCMDGHQIGYTNITISQSGNGKIEKEYYPPRNFKDNATPVNTSSINAFPDFADPKRDRIIWPTSNFKERFYADCDYDPILKENRWVYYSPTTSYRSNESCSTLEHIDDFYCEKNLAYYAGGGRFHAEGYSSSGSSYSYYDVYGLSHYAFRIYEIDGIPFNGYIDNKANFVFNYDTFKWGKVNISGSNIFPFPPLSDKENDEFLYNQLKQELIYAEGGAIATKEIYYDYDLYRTTSENERVFGIVANNHFAVSQGLKATAWDACEDYVGKSNQEVAAYFFGNRHGFYSLPKAWSKYYYNVNSTSLLTQVRTVNRLDGQIVETIENNKYNNDFLMKEKTLASNSLQNSETTYYYYPKDSPNGISTTSATINRMISDNLLSYVIKEEKKINANTLVSGKIYNYRVENDLVVLSDIKESKTDGVYEDAYMFDKYDSYGNIIEAHEPHNYPISYLWAWDIYHSFPVIMAKNTDYQTLTTALSSILPDLPSNFRQLLGDLKTEQQRDLLKSYNLKLRSTNLLSNSQITTYTYLKDIGMNSMTKPNGVTEFYIYDSYGRLSEIRNENYQLTKKYSYNYANQ